MKLSYNNKAWFSAIIVTILLMACMVSTLSVSAATSYAIDGYSYELSDDCAYSTIGKIRKSFLCYGAKSIGSMNLSGSLNQKIEKNGWPYIGATGDVVLSYTYNGAYQSDIKECWNLSSSNETTVNGIDLGKDKVQLGAIIVESSQDGTNYEVAFKDTNVFHKQTSDIKGFYTIKEDQVRSGCYYRITIAYRMERKTGTEKTLVVINNDVYDYREFVETYRFYIAYGQNPVIIKDIDTGSEVTNNKVTRGFVIDKKGAAVTVSLKNRTTGIERQVSDLTSIVDQGSYQITITTKLGKKFTRYVTVSEGMEVTTVSPDTTISDTYELGSDTSSSLPFGTKSLTTLKIGHKAGSRVSTGKVSGYDAYGITATENVSIYMRIKDFSTQKAKGWVISSDVWGKKEKQTINGHWSGVVGTGALIVQKSTNGVNWTVADNGKYANGLFTTDFYTHYGDQGDVLIYTPDGKEILNGLYLRILYAYQVEKSDAKDSYRILEAYEFYLCSNELGSVTFKNLESNSTTEEIGENEGINVAVYNAAETLLSGSGTVRGFKIDTSLNPTVEYTVYRNGALVFNSSNKTRYIETGKYEIHLKSAIGTTETVIIYVDPQTEESALAHYFGDGFLSGKRIFSEGEYPVYEGGKVTYHIERNKSGYLPISGCIHNTTTGEMIEIVSGNKDVEGIITSPGQYTATFTTCPSNENGELPGDYRVFTFKFEVIAEGTAPGPAYNEGKLNEYNTKFATDAYPKYYGLMFRAGKGDITLAFASKEAAMEYAYNYEKGLVEEQSDGSYRYKGPYGLLGQKESYDSLWDLTDATQYFAEQAVHEYFFDMSDEFTYRSLAPEVIEATTNLEELNLQQSVVIFADGEKEISTNLESYPIINDKITAYLDVETGKVTTAWEGFEFVTDKYGGIDSQKVIITDVNGKEYPIRYSSSVGKQLEEQECPSGIITITETTKYGDSQSYQAIYIAPGDNKSEVSLVCYNGLDSREVVIDSDSKNLEITADSFSIKSIADQLDPYALVIVKHNREKHAYVVGETINDIWTDSGEYEIKCVNRMGYSYSFAITVVESDNAVISFAGTGTESLTSILTTYGCEDIELPTLNRYGYDFVGYIYDGATQTYLHQLPQVTFRGEQTLTAVWVPKQITITLCDELGEIIDTLDVEYGRTYALPIFEPKEGYEFSGWVNFGSLVEGDSFTVETEDSIVLRASIAQKEAESEQPKFEEPKKSKAGFAWIWILVALVAFVAVFVWQKDNLKQIVKRRSGEVEKPEDDM